MSRREDSRGDRHPDRPRAVGTRRFDGRAWLDRTVLERFGGFDLELTPAKTDPVWYAVLPTVLYNRMLAPLLPMSVKGVIWYQGESMSPPPAMPRLFTQLIESWRDYFRNRNAVLLRADRTL